MSDMGEFFTAWRQHTKEIKARRLDAADKAALPGFFRHTAWHWSRDLCGSQLDYWPSTARWRWRDKTYRGDVQALIGFIEARTQDTTK